MLGENVAARDAVEPENAPNVFSYKYITDTYHYRIMDIDEFYRVIGNDLTTKFGKKFQVDGYCAPETPSALFNNSVFAYKWTIFYSTYFKKRNMNDMALNCFHTDEYFWDTFCNVITEYCNADITPLMQQYLTEIGINIDELVDELEYEKPGWQHMFVFPAGQSDWRPMVVFYAEEHTVYWIVNINPKSMLFEYVLIYGENYSASLTHTTYELVHLAKFDIHKNLISVYEDCSGINDKSESEIDSDEDNSVVLK
jgi:hypothetical protein